MTITPEEVAKLHLKAMQGDIVPILFKVSDMADLIARMDEALKAADALEAKLAKATDTLARIVRGDDDAHNWAIWTLAELNGEKT